MDESIWWKIREVAGRQIVEFPNPEALVFSPAGAEYFEEDNDLEIYAGGRGGAKDHNMEIKKLIRAYCEYPKLAANPIRAGYRYHLGLFASTEENLIENLAKFRSFIPKVPGKARDGTENYRFDVEKQQFHLFGRDQLVISCVSLYNPTAVRSKGFDDVILTEAQLMKESDVEKEVFGVVFRPGYPGRMGMTGNPDEGGWFDQACDQAENGVGYYGNWKFYHVTTFDNPHCSPRIIEQALRLREKNPWRYRVEVMGERNVRVPKDAAPDCPFTTGLLECAFTSEYFPAPANPIIYYDLAWTGRDKLAALFTDPARNMPFRLDFYEKTVNVVDPNNPNTEAIIKIMERDFREFPGAKMYYDATGPLGRSLAAHIPRHMVGRVKPIVWHQSTKNARVGDAMTRLVPGDDGKSIGWKLPDPKSYPFGSAQQRQNFIELYGQIMHYREIQTTTKGGQPSIYYTKGEGWNDDGVDAWTSTATLLPPTRKPVVRRPIRERSLGIYA
jgi:hypothetical protein